MQIALLYNHNWMLRLHLETHQGHIVATGVTRTFFHAQRLTWQRHYNEVT